MKLSPLFRRIYVPSPCSAAIQSFAFRNLSPAVAFAHNIPDGIVLPSEFGITSHLYRTGTEVRMKLPVKQIVVEPYFAIVQEPAAAIPRVAFWPEGKRGKVWRLADGGPRRHGRLLFSGEIDQKLAIGRKVATPLVNPAFEPLARFKFVGLCVPLEQEHLLRWTAPKNNALGFIACKQHPQASWRFPRSVHLATL